MKKWKLTNLVGERRPKEVEEGALREVSQQVDSMIEQQFFVLSNLYIFELFLLELHKLLMQQSWQISINL